MIRYSLCQPSCRSLVLLSALLLCAAPGIRADDTAKRPTLRNSPDLPVREIQQVLSHEAWETLKDREYAAYVILDGRTDRQGRVEVRRPLHCHPDKSWMKYIPQVMKGAQIKTIGVTSRMIARVKACVVFYPAPTGYTALVFATQDIRTPVPHQATVLPAYAGFMSIEIPATAQESK